MMANNAIGKTTALSLLFITKCESNNLRRVQNVTEPCRLPDFEKTLRYLFLQQPLLKAH